MEWKIHTVNLYKVDEISVEPIRIGKQNYPHSAIEAK
jgi:hypothetical protein